MSVTFSGAPRVAFAAAFILFLGASPARANFHLAHIEEVMTGVNGTTDVQFVEILMELGGQGVVGGSKLSAFDENGVFQRIVLTVPGGVGSGSDRSWIMASTDFAAASGITPDFTFTSTGGQGLVAEDGMLCWGKPNDDTNPDSYVDCLAYGAYVGPTNNHIGTPHPENPFGHSLQRLSETGNNAADYLCADTAMPRNNASETGSIAGSSACAVCGNDTIELTEQCDGSDDAACPGLCLPNCACTNACGNDNVEGAEECDGSDDEACGNGCQVNCTCAPDAPLSKDPQKCVATAVKNAGKVLSTVLKTTSSCVKNISKGKEAEALAVCVQADEKGKIEKASDKLAAGVSDLCSFPYAIDCDGPCEATDEDGLSAAADDDTEVTACLDCVSVAAGESAPASFGLHTMLLEGVTLALESEDKDLAKCQSSLVKVANKAQAPYVKGMSKCLKGALKSGAIPPVPGCLLADPKDKAEKSTAAIAKAVDKCGQATVPFDAGNCSGLAAAALTNCIDAAVTCSACRWGNTVLGSDGDCEVLDNGASDGTCP